jgi:hypothetical protein
MSATRTSGLPRRPRPGTRAASYRNGLVHRVKEGTYLQATWLCGGAATVAILVRDPAEFGGICERCEAAFTGSVVYRCYSADGRLLYIGSCRIWAHRESTHRTRTPWWHEVTRVDRQFWPSLPAARRAERAAIWAEAPLYNKQHNQKRFHFTGHTYVPVAA